MIDFTRNVKPVGKKLKYWRRQRDTADTEIKRKKAERKLLYYKACLVVYLEQKVEKEEIEKNLQKLAKKRAKKARRKARKKRRKEKKIHHGLIDDSYYCISSQKRAILAKLKAVERRNQ